MLEKLNLFRFIKSIFVGGIGIIPNFIIFNIMILIGVNLWVSWFTGFFMGALSNYIFNEIWTFKRDVK